MPGSGRLLTALVLALVLGLAARSAAAADLQIQGCAEPFADELRWLLALELPGGQAPARVLARCDGTVVTVDARQTGADGAPVQRTLALAPVEQPARARLVALAAAELVATLDRRQPAATGPAAAAPPRWSLSGAATLGVMGRSDRLAYGGALAVDHLTWRWLGWRAALALQHGGQQVALGHAAAWLASTLAALTVRWDTPRLGLVGGLGGRLGLAHLQGRARDPAAAAEGTVTGPWFGPHALLELRMPVGRLKLCLGVELTYVVRPVTGRLPDGTRFGVDGLLVLGSAGIGLPL